MKRSRITALALGTSVVLTLLAGCGSDDPDPTATEPTTAEPTEEPADPADPSEEPSEEPSSSPTEAEPELPPFGGTDRQMAKNRGEPDLVLTDVRTGSHDGYDRVVMEFAGNGRPGWVVEYVDEAVQEGSGDVITLDGESILQVFASGTTYPAEGQDFFPTGPLSPGPGGSAVSDVHVVGTFEGYTQMFAALDGPPADVRVFRLGNPSRLVVDVRAD